MFSITQINITQFKNYSFSSFDFGERVIGICGLNGVGKTNLLDAIYYLCFTRSYFSRNDALNVQFDKDGFRIEGNFSVIPGENGNMVGNDENPASSGNFVCIFRTGGKKEFHLKGIPYNKFSEHIGKFPCVMVAPDDIELITGGSELRRRYMDTILSQVDATYLQELIVYNKVLLQRNSLLKRFAEQGKTDWPLLEVLDDQLMKPGKYIFAKRRDFAAALIPLVQKFYARIANNEESIILQYESQVNENNFKSLLHQFRDKDCILQRTNAGIHKDDLLMQLNQQPFKIIASQGQRKSLLFALKLAEFEFLKLNKGFAPLLLLDDVFEKLDDRRMDNLLRWVCIENKGQVFITDTHRERLDDAFGSLGINYRLIEL